MTDAYVKLAIYQFDREIGHVMMPVEIDQHSYFQPKPVVNVMGHQLPLIESDDDE